MADMRDREQERDLLDSRDTHDRGNARDSGSIRDDSDVNDAGYAADSRYSGSDDDADRFRPDDNPRVAALGDLGDFKVAEGFPDPRGWDVAGADGQKIGKVHELIVDTGAMRTRYLDISLDSDAARGSGDRDVLVPIGAARVSDSDDRVMLDSLSAAELASMPAYNHEPITRDFEDSLLAQMPNRTPTDHSARSADADYYKQPHFDDSGFFGARSGRAARSEHTKGEGTQRVLRSEEELEIGKRQVQAGEVDVRKRVETEKVREPVKVRREDVTIERRPIAGDEARSAAGGTKIADSGETIRIPITEEEIVVNKRPVVKEEIVIKKHAVSDDKTVEADVRKERVEIDRGSTREGSAARDEERDRGAR